MEVNERFGKKMNQDVNGYKKLFWKEVVKWKSEKMGICSKIKYKTGSLGLGDYDVQETWKKYFEDL